MVLSVKRKVKSEKWGIEKAGEGCLSALLILISRSASRKDAKAQRLHGDAMHEGAGCRRSNIPGNTVGNFRRWAKTLAALRLCARKKKPHFPKHGDRHPGGGLDLCHWRLTIVRAMILPPQYGTRAKSTNGLVQHEKPCQTGQSGGRKCRMKFSCYASILHFPIQGSKLKT